MLMVIDFSNDNQNVFCVTYPCQGGLASLWFTTRWCPPSDGTLVEKTIVTTVISPTNPS